MSAYIVNKKHIDAMLAFGIHSNEYGNLKWFTKEVNQRSAYSRGNPWGPGVGVLTSEYGHSLSLETANRVGQMLMDENALSVNHRYDEEKESEKYFFSDSLSSLAPVEILKAIDCYDYQSCEHPEWENSEAKVFCNALRKRAIGLLPGYDSAQWEIKGE